MKKLSLVLMIVTLTPGVTLGQSHPPIEGPAVDGSPAWFLQGSFPDPTGRTIVQPGGQVTIPPGGGGPGAADTSSAHGLAVDPRNGDVWIGDREEYRIVVYSGDGKFLKTMQMRNLVCALYFDSHGEPWMATGQDGQFLKLDRSGKVLGAVGNGMGIGTGQFIEASYWVMDTRDNLYAGDTSVGRVTKMVAPGK